MDIPGKCNCDVVYCEHRWPFRRDEGEWQGTLWVMFSRFKWWRRWRGGIWQQFNLGTPSSPYLVWMEMERTLEEAILLEDHRKEEEIIKAQPERRR